MLNPNTALAKDKRTGLAPMQHRHFATIAEIISRADDKPSAEEMAHHFARLLPKTNPHFDKARFLAACGVES